MSNYLAVSNKPLVGKFYQRAVARPFLTAVCHFTNGWPASRPLTALRKFPTKMALPTRQPLWHFILFGLTFFLSSPAFAAYVPLTGVNKLSSSSPSLGGGSNCVIMNGGGVKCWGYGHGSIAMDVTGLISGVMAIAPSCALTSGGGVKCWSKNPTTNSWVLMDVTGLTSGVTAIASAEGIYNCALTSSGGVKCWGANSYGQLGNNSTTDSSIPVDVTGLTTGVTAIALEVD